MPKFTATKTAKAEHKTLKIPLSAQYHGVSEALLDSTNCIPVGNASPKRNPTGIRIIMEVKILASIVADTICDSRLRKTKHTVAIAPAIING